MPTVNGLDDQVNISDVDDLRSRYHDPMPAVVHKARPVIDPAAAELIALTPLIVIATSSDSGADSSPRGGPPGFVVTLDEHTLAFGDLAGNNRLDSYANIVEHPAVGLLFLVPGLEETLRVNGRARITTDPDVLDRTTVDGRRPKLAMVVDVEECYIHCGKALRRSGLWDPTTWPATDQRPTAGEVIVDQFSLDMDPGTIDADLEVGYRETLWENGGE
jgi:PPOX class probable FMN-dependent enzyme